MDLSFFKKIAKIKVSFNKGLAPKPLPSNRFANPKILEVDLIQDEIPVKFEAKKYFSYLAIFLILSLFLLGEIWFMLDSWEKREIYKKTQLVKDEIAKVEQSIAEVEAQSTEAVIFKNRLEIGKSLYLQHIYWTNFLSYLEKNTLANLFYSGLDVDTSGKYAFKAMTNDYRAIGAQLKYFNKSADTILAKISNENIDDASSTVSETKVYFDLDLNIKSDIFTR
jgi:hypothetical protein